MRRNVASSSRSRTQVLRAKFMLAAAREGNFTIVVGGHSAAAGHGNWANES